MCILSPCAAKVVMLYTCVLICADVTPANQVTRFYAGVAGPPVYAGVARKAVSSEYLRKMPVIFVHV